MNAKNIDFTGIAILIGGAVVLFAGYKIYKKTSDAVGAFGESASEVVKNVVDLPGKAIDKVAASLGFTNASTSQTVGPDMVLIKGKTPTDKEIYDHLFVQFPGDYKFDGAPTESTVFQQMSNDSDKVRLGNTDYKPPSIVYDGLGVINDAATLNGNF